jgi:4-methyl-5(b-hydroxyethyl)-thiazole monophosphate biosynthesis
MPNALVLLAAGFEEIEAITIIDLLRRADIEVTVAGLELDSVTGSHNISVIPDAYYLDVYPDIFDILILPGGQPGTNNLKSDDKVINWIKNHFKEGKKLAAVCAAPIVFHAAGITSGLKLTSYPTEKSVFSDSDYKKENVVKDGNVITGRAVGTAIDFALEIIAELQGRDKAEEIKKMILHKSAK